MRSPWITLTVLALLLALPAAAQFTSGIEGTVHDPAGAVVPGSEVIVVNQGTQVTLRTVTNESGFFRVTQLPPGNYRVEVRRTGFQSWAQTAIALEGSEVRTLYPVLTVGEQRQTVEVAATLAAVETGASKVSRSIETRTVETAPMVGRNIYGGVAALAPGITGSGGLFGGATGSGSLNQDSFQTEPGFQINAGGQRQEANEFQIDGASVNGNSRDGIVNITPEPDTVGEIRVSANTFSAEKGRNSGALVEVYTKSGTNQFHGTISEFHSNNRLTARTVFQQRIPVFRRNEFGFTAGGPIVKDRTFIFGGLHILRSSDGRTDIVRVETPQFKQFVQQRFPNSMAARFFSRAPVAVDPTADIFTVARVRTANPGRFPSDVFPDDLPAVGTATIDQTLNRPAKQWNMRVDHNFAGYSDRLYFNFMRTTPEGQQANVRPLYRWVTPNTGIFAKANWTRTLSPTLLNEASMSYTRAAGGNPGTAEDKELPNAGTITGITATFNQGPLGWAHNNFAWRDVISWIRGNHNVRFGVDIDRQRGEQNRSLSITRPNFTFANILDFAQDLPFTQTGPAVNLKTGGIAVETYRRARMLYMGAFVQDDWKVAPRFTLNLGLRWDYFGHWSTTENGQIPFPYFRLGQGASLRDQIASGSMQTLEKGYVTENTPSGWAPRFGFAWDVFGNGSTAIRGGYGIYYSRVANLSFVSNAGENPPAFALPSLTVQQNARLSYALGGEDGLSFPIPPDLRLQTDARGGVVGVATSVGGMELRPDQPLTHNWSVSIQRRLFENFTFEADYLGTRSANLYTQTNMNRFPGDLVINSGRLTRLNSSFGPIIQGSLAGQSDGHLGTLMLGRRFSRSWSMRGIYTFGKALDYTSSNDNGVGGGQNVFDALNIAGQRGRADYHVGRRFAVDAVWESPDPWKRGWKSKALGGWNLSAIAIFQSGRPFSVVSQAVYPNGDFNADGNNYDAPDTPGFGNTISAERSDFINGLFPQTAFPRPTGGRQGTLGRNTFDGPGLANVNLGIIKSMRIPWFTSEGATFEIRGELFNLFNRVNLTQPNGDLSNALFGKSTGQNLPRGTQLGLRIQY
jgi:Carboxypeptidase regulatory-like domain